MVLDVEGFQKLVFSFLSSPVNLNENTSENVQDIGSDN